MNNLPKPDIDFSTEGITANTIGTYIGLLLTLN